MLLTNEQRKQVSQLLTNKISWIVRNNASLKDIEVCEGLAAADPITLTCALCVAANRTAYSGEVCTYDHPSCKCKFGNGKIVVQVDFPMSKLTGYLFTNANKAKMMHKIGYDIEDSEELRQTLSAVIKKQYEEGAYKYKYLNTTGVHIQIDTVIVGKRDHTGEMHECHIGCVLWPHGKIKVATPLIVDDID